MKYLIVLLVLCSYFIYGETFAATESVENLWESYYLRPAKIKPGKYYPFEACFQKAAKKYDLPLTMLLAVAKGESNFNTNAVSKANCYGIMQIQYPGTAAHLGIENKKDLFIACKNILAGARYLRELMDRYKDNIHLALGAYNYGPARIPVSNEGQAIRMPKGAQWYSSYIYHHLGKIINGDWELILKQKTLDIFTFRQPYRAKGFMDYIRKNLPDIKLDWVKGYWDGYKVVMLYQSDKELDLQKKKLSNLGLNL